MISGNVTVTNETGLHARPASQFIAFVNRYKEAEVMLLKDGKVANAKSILNLLTMGLSKGTEVTVQVTGGDEETILAEIVDYIKNMKD